MNSLDKEIIKLARNVHLKYFDPGCLVRLENRFSARQLGREIFAQKTHIKRDGVLYIDSYADGCVHNIQYPSQFAWRGRKRKWNRPIPFPTSIASVCERLDRETTNHRNVHVVLGKDSDPFMWMDQKYQVTRELLNQLNVRWASIGSLVIQTRSDLVAHDNYIDELIAMRDVICLTVRMYMFHGTEEDQRRLEPGAPSNRRRLKAVERLKANGVNVETFYESREV